MAYTPPNTFTPGTVINSLQMQENSDDLRVYLHSGIISTDLKASRWVDTRHIQSPIVDPYLATQHGVTGWQGGQNSGGPLVRATFTTSYMTGGKYGAVDWIPVPQTALRISARRACHLIFHYNWELVAGPDNAPNVSPRIPDIDQRLVTIAPYIGSTLGVKTSAAQDTINNHNGWGGSSTKSPENPYNIVGWGCKSGTHLQYVSGPSNVTFGLCSYSEVDRVSIINWTVSIEAYYL